MTDAAVKYRELTVELLLRRELEGGDLSQAEEMAFVGTLDALWHQMSEDEHEAEEALLRFEAVAPLELEWKDRELTTGTTEFPREKAA